MPLGAPGSTGMLTLGHVIGAVVERASAQHAVASTCPGRFVKALADDHADSDDARTCRPP
jgi:hypothetical protein